MSAYLTEEKSIATLAAHIYAINAHKYGPCAALGIKSVEDIALALATENVLSVSYRYKNDVTFADKLYIYACRDLAQKMTTPPELSPSHLAKMVEHYEYQSCERDKFFYQSPAYRLLCSLREQLVKKLPGFDAAPWE